MSWVTYKKRRGSKRGMQSILHLIDHFGDSLTYNATEMNRILCSKKPYQTWHWDEKKWKKQKTKTPKISQQNYTLSLNGTLFFFNPCQKSIILGLLVGNQMTIKCTHFCVNWTPFYTWYVHLWKKKWESSSSSL